ncbi:MAG TPA: hypothetical protein VF453_19050 [Burkholderiaceae bacterium]
MPPPGMPRASRRAPPEVPPVEHDGVLYEPLASRDVSEVDPQTVYVVARDAATRTPLWWTPLYRIELVPHLERDVQMVFIRSLALSEDGHRLLAENSRGRRFEIDIASHEVHELPAAPR